MRRDVAHAFAPRPSRVSLRVAGVLAISVALALPTTEQITAAASPRIHPSEESTPGTDPAPPAPDEPAPPVAAPRVVPQTAAPGQRVTVTVRLPPDAERPTRRPTVQIAKRGVGQWRVVARAAAISGKRFRASFRAPETGSYRLRIRITGQPTDPTRLRVTNRGRHLFVLAGQSNMERLNATSAFRPGVRRALGSRRVEVVKHAISATSLQQWHPQWRGPLGRVPKNSGQHYWELLRKVRRQTTSGPISTVTLAWIQGERDARLGRAGTYEANLRSFLRRTKQDFGQRRFSVVIGRISDYGLSGKRADQWQSIREIQVRVANAARSRAWVDSDDLNNKLTISGQSEDALHLNREGYQRLGARLAEASAALVLRQLRQR